MDEREAQSICERITPRLAHANAAVVLSAVKVLMKYMEMMSSDAEFNANLTKKLSPPLVTLLSSEPEVQYVALRNINLIIQKRPDILKHEMKVFFVKYNDPIYVKLEKLDIMIRLASQANIAQVLSELKEYATEVDVDFVRKSVRAIGRCAIKVEQSAERCVSTLLDLIQTKVNYVVQEAIVVIKDIFRKYPNKYESIIATLCENLDTLDEPEARASMIWIIGEYAERIDNADELLESFLDNFHDENAQVQLQLLTAIVKLFLKRPTDTQELVQQVLSLATQESENPDLRDRGFIYWRLLSTDPAAAKDVVLAEEPLIAEETDLLEPTLLDELICHIASLASVYHKPPSAFVEGKIGLKRMLPSRAEGEYEATESRAGASEDGAGTVIAEPGSLIGDLLDMDIGGAAAAAAAAVPRGAGGAAPDLLGGGLDQLLAAGPPDPSVPGAAANNLLGDIFGLEGGAGTHTGYIPPKQVWLSAAKGKGLEISGSWSLKNNMVTMELTLENKAMQAMNTFAVQLNKNSFGLAPQQQINVPILNAGQTLDVSLPMTCTGPVQKMDPLTNIQVAVKNSIDIFYFACIAPLHIFFSEEGAMEKKTFLNTWKDIPAANEIQHTIEGVECPSDGISTKMGQNNAFTVAKRTLEGQDMIYQSLKLTNGIWGLVEIKLSPGNPTITLSFKSRVMEIAQAVFQVYDAILHN